MLVGSALLSLASAAHAAPFAYITQPSSNSVAVIDTANNMVVTTIAAGDAEAGVEGIGFTPFGVAVHPSGSHVYVGNEEGNTISVIETTQHAVVTTVLLRPDVGPAGLAVHPNGSRLYVANQFENSVSIIDTATHVELRRVPVGSLPLGIALNPAGTRLYVVNNGSNTVSVIDTVTFVVAPPVPVGPSPVGVAIDPSGARAYVTNAAVSLGATTSTVSVLETSTNTVIATVPVGLSPRGVAVHPSGSHVYVANGSSGTVSVIEAASNTVVAAPYLGVGLYGIGVTPSGRHVYVASQGDSLRVGQGVYVLATSGYAVSGPVTNSDTGRPTAFGLFITPAASTCDTAAYEQALLAVQRQVASLHAANQALITDNGRLRSELVSLRVTIASFVDRLFGERTDSNVAVAVRAAASTELAAARTAAPRDWRLRVAQHAFEHGEQAMRRRDWSHAVHVFRTVHTLLDRLVGDRRPGYGSPVPAPAGSSSTPPVVATGGCSTTALEQSMAVARQQLASLQGINQALGKENGQLQADLNTARSTVESFVDRLFGDRADGNVAAAAQAGALAKLNAAKAAKPRDWRLKSAQHSFDNGQSALRRHDWGRAVHEFRETHELAERILSDHKGYAHHHHSR